MMSSINSGALTDQRDWESYWSNPVAPVRFDVNFTPTYATELERFLPASQKLSLIELGCVPGNHLAYFARRFGFTVSGVDFSPRIADTRASLADSGATLGDFFEGDVFEVPYPQKYDIVYSAGFAEHFTNVSKVLTLHADLALEGGFVVIEVPNLRWLNYVLRMPTDGPCLRQHVRTLMSTRRLADAAIQAGLAPVFCDYVGNFSGINIHDRRDGLYFRVMRRMQFTTVRWLRRNVMWRPVFARASRFWSPVTLLIARKQ